MFLPSEPLPLSREMQVLLQLSGSEHAPERGPDVWSMICAECAEDLAPLRTNSHSQYYNGHGGSIS
jgi:hypothetical protein